MIQAGALLKRLKDLGTTHVLGLPDNCSAALFRLLSRDDDIQLLTVTREAEAFAIASGLWIGGKTPAVLVQNTGFLESGDSFRGTVTRMRIPVICLITYRGHSTMTQHAIDKDIALSEDLLSRPELDSAALITERTLDAWGVPYHSLKEDKDLDRIAAAFAQAQQRSRPVALLVAADMA